MMITYRILHIILKAICISILLSAAFMKLTSHPTSIHVFTLLEMEPFGRYLIGLIELSAAGLLFTRHHAASGAMISLSVMIGAIIAHISKLGLVILDDSGFTVVLLVILLCSSTGVAYFNRFDIPLIGSSFHKDKHH